MYLGKNIGKWNFSITLLDKYKSFCYGVDLFDLKCLIEKEYASPRPLVPREPLIQFQFELNLLNFQVFGFHISRFLR